MSRSVVLSLCALSLSACASSTELVPPDAAVLPHDAGVADGSARDGAARDLGVRDLGVRDLGGMDAGAPDAPAITECSNEVDPSTRTRFNLCGPYRGDGIPDDVDTDDDNDGLPDTLEAVLGLNTCALDSDGDGVDDGFEGAYSLLHCPDGRTPTPGSPADACTLGAGGGVPDPGGAYAIVRFGDPIVKPTIETWVPTDAGVSDVWLALHPSSATVLADGRRFVVGWTPACNDTHDSSCWTEPAGTAHAAAVTTYDTSTFFGVAPGTVVRFALDLADSDVPPAADAPTIFYAAMDVLIDGVVVDRRDVIVVVPGTDPRIPSCE